MSEEAFIFYVTPLLIGSNDLLVPQSLLPPGIHGVSDPSVHCVLLICCFVSSSSSPQICEDAWLPTLSLRCIVRSL